MSKYALVPVEQLEKLEQARKDLHGVLKQFDDDSVFGATALALGVTSIMYRLANRRWPTLDELPDNRLIGFTTEEK